MLGRLVLAFLFIGLVETGLDAQTTKDKADPKPIVGKVVSVDMTKKAVTIVVDGKNQTFTVTDATAIVGPRGGKSLERLKDDRFTKGYEITITPAKDPKVAAKIQLPVRAAAPKDKTPPKDKKDK